MKYILFLQFIYIYDKNDISFFPLTIQEGRWCQIQTETSAKYVDDGQAKCCEVIN